MSLYNPDQAARDTWAGQSLDAFRVRFSCYVVCITDDYHGGVPGSGKKCNRHQRTITDVAAYRTNEAHKLFRFNGECSNVPVVEGQS